MRDIVQELLHDITGQSLYLDVPEGRPTSVTSVTIVEAADDDDGTTESAVGAPSVEASPDTFITAAAGVSEADPTAITVNSAAGIERERPYLLASAAGHSEWIELVSLNGTAGTLRTPLLNDYALTTTTLKSTRITAAVDATWIADDANLSDEESTEPRYRAVWLYVVAGKTHRRQGAFDVVRYSAQHHVTPLDVDMRFPGWLDRLPVDYRKEQGRTLITQAWRAVKMDLRADGKLGRWVRNLDVVSELVLCRSNLIGVELRALTGGATPDQLAAAADIYKQRYQQLIREPHVELAANPMGGTRPAVRAPLFRR